MDNEDNSVCNTILRCHTFTGPEEGGEKTSLECLYLVPSLSLMTSCQMSTVFMFVCHCLFYSFFFLFLCHTPPLLPTCFDLVFLCFVFFFSTKLPVVSHACRQRSQRSIKCQRRAKPAWRRFLQRLCRVASIGVLSANAQLFLPLHITTTAPPTTTTTSRQVHDTRCPQSV